MRAEASRGVATERTRGAKPGRVIAVIGPSGVGKDSVMAGLLRRHPTLSIARRTITRPSDPGPPNSGAEDHVPVSAEEFRALDRAGAFALSWQAHDF